MEAPYLEGVPYLSREEEASARRILLARQDKNAIADIQINADDLDSLEFVRRVRHDIELWWNRDEVSITVSSCHF
jgi:poly(A)-specific ribonuclease